MNKPRSRGRSARDLLEMEHLNEQRVLGQEPISFLGSLDQAVRTVCIKSPYGRFGNNFYQVVNALVIADFLECEILNVPDFGWSDPSVCSSYKGLQITMGEAQLQEGGTLYGSFYAPFRMERAFEMLPLPKLNQLLRKVGQGVYGACTKLDRSSRRSVAVHFRGGDIFTKNAPVHPWYVQPPASYYTKAIVHALGRNSYDSVDLIFEDETNPSLNCVSDFLRNNGVRFTYEKQDIASDIRAMLSAECIVSSASTLPEACSLLSDNLSDYYSFRSHSSQIDFAPFMQSKVGAILRMRDVSGFIIDDATLSYIQQKNWTNSEQQLALMVQFKEEDLRLFQSSGI